MVLSALGIDIDRYWRVNESQDITVLALDPLTGDLLDLTGAQAKYTLATPTPIKKDSTTAGISIDVSASTLTVNLGNDTTLSVAPGIYDHELTVLLANGDVRTIFQGIVQFVPAVADSFFLP